jgi:hypothetical protein
MSKKSRMTQNRDFCTELPGHINPRQINAAMFASKEVEIQSARVASNMVQDAAASTYT